MKSISTWENNVKDALVILRKDIIKEKLDSFSDSVVKVWYYALDLNFLLFSPVKRQGIGTV
jgi:hypothetical protein